jgi:hypothetical protein
MSNANNLSAFEVQYIEDDLKNRKNLKRKIYFDSYDIICMIQGIWHFNQNYKFNFEKFRNQKNIEILGIAGKGWIGKISLLKPHQDEFIFNLTGSENDFPKSINYTKDDIEDEFLYNLIKDKPKKILDLDDISFLNYMNNLKSNSILLFKSNFVLSPYFWLDRYKKYFEDDRTIVLQFDKLDNSILIKSSIFKNSLRKLELIRQGKAFSNYMDALALAQLQSEVDAFINSNLTLPLPIFYTGSSYLRKVMLEIYHENPMQLSYPHPTKSEKFIPVFRFEPFFMITPFLTSRNLMKQSQKLLLILKKLRKALPNSLRIIIWIQKPPFWKPKFLSYSTKILI